MNHSKLAISAIAIFILVACSPSQSAVETAIYQTQAAAATNTSTQTLLPTDTRTPFPTDTPTPSATLSPTPDLRTNQGDPPDLIMIRADLPLDANYYIPNETWTGMLHNVQIVSSWTVEKGRAYLADTGRIDGMWISFNRGSTTVIAPQEIYDNVAIFKTAEGAQLVVTKYEDSDLENGYTELVNPPQIGDKTREFIRKQMQSSGEYRVWISVAFSYRNIYHYIEGYGWEKEVDLEYIENVARKILSRMEVAPLASLIHLYLLKNG